MGYTLTNVVTRTQAVLGDQWGDFWVSANLLTHINTAYRSLDRAFRLSGVRFAKARAVLTPVTAGTLKLDRTTTPPMPADFLEPIQLWEKNVGAPDTDYTQLEFAPASLPDIVQGTNLSVFDWFQGSLYFVGATTDRTVRADYQRGITDLVNGTDPLVIDDALDPVAYVAAAEAATSIGQGQLGSTLLAKGTQMIDSLVSLEIRTMQRIPRRRQPANVAPRYTAP